MAINCAFGIGFNEPIERIIERARSKIASIGGKFEGNIDSGTYFIPTGAGNIIGTYKVQVNTINFEITSKPAIISCKKIESELRKYLSDSSNAYTQKIFSSLTIYTGLRGGKYYINSMGKKSYIKQY